LLPTPASGALDALQHDALVELFNIGVGRAANALGEIVGEEVTMSVPTIRFLPRAQARCLLASSGAGEARVCGVRQHYDGGFRTEAIIMFAEDACLDLVRLMVGDAVPADELTAMEQEAMGEIGNIVLNSCLGTLADLLEQELCGSLPVVQVATGGALLTAADGASHASAPLVMLLQIELALAAHRAHGQIAFVLDMAALTQLRGLVDSYLARCTDAATPTPTLAPRPQ
ncbi:MAG: hypothetical protein ACJ8HI_13180, partial [Massilia sp.]